MQNKKKHTHCDRVAQSTNTSLLRRMQNGNPCPMNRASSRIFCKSGPQPLGSGTSPWTRVGTSKVVSIRAFTATTPKRNVANTQLNTMIAFIFFWFFVQRRMPKALLNIQLLVTRNLNAPKHTTHEIVVNVFGFFKQTIVQ